MFATTLLALPKLCVTVTVVLEWLFTVTPLLVPDKGVMFVILVKKEQKMTDRQKK